MSELIKITKEFKKDFNGEEGVCARDLHRFLENTDNVNTWFQRQAIRAMLDWNLDFIRVAVLQPSGQIAYDYVMTLAAAKEISMLNGGDKGKQARQYFIEMEKRARQLEKDNLPKVPATFSAALMFAAEQQLVIEQQTARIEEMAPKEEFFDQVMDSNTTIDMAAVAKVSDIGIGRNRLFRFLRESKILREDNTPYQRYVDAGYFRLVGGKFNDPSDGSTHITLTTRVYQKGVDFIIKKYKEKCVAD